MCIHIFRMHQRRRAGAFFSAATINHFIYGKNVYSRLLKRRSPRESERAALTSRGFGFNAKLAARTKTVGSHKYMGKITCFHSSSCAHTRLSDTFGRLRGVSLVPYLCTFLRTVALRNWEWSLRGIYQPPNWNTVHKLLSKSLTLDSAQ